MTLHPDVQSRAQAEIDAVVGHDRLPDFSDKDKLPYLNAIISELLRWLIIAPLGTWNYVLLLSARVNVKYARRSPAYHLCG